MLAQTIQHALERPNSNKAIYFNSEYAFALGSDQGQYRRENQDQLLLALLPSQGKRPALWIAAIADGMGGMQAGKQCAIHAISDFIDTIYREISADLPQVLTQAIHSANEVVWQRYQGEGGSTLTALVIAPDLELTCCAHVGDSRLYGHKGRHIEQLSQDDDNGTGRLRQFVGIGAELVPKVQQISTNLCDDYSQYLLTTDGVHGMPEAAFGSVVREGKLQPEVICTRLLTLAPWCGGRDNASIAVLQAKSWQGQTSPKQLRIFSEHGEIVINKQQPIGCCQRGEH